MKESLVTVNRILSPCQTPTTTKENKEETSNNVILVNVNQLDLEMEISEFLLK